MPLRVCVLRLFSTSPEAVAASTTLSASFHVELLASIVAGGNGGAIVALGVEGEPLPVGDLLAFPGAGALAAALADHHARGTAEAAWEAWADQVQEGGEAEDLVVLNFQSLPALAPSVVMSFARLLSADREGGRLGPSGGVKSLRIVQVDGLGGGSTGGGMSDGLSAAKATSTAITAAGAWSRQLMRKLQQHQQQQQQRQDQAAGQVQGEGRVAAAGSPSPCSFIAPVVRVVRADWSSVAMAAKEAGASIAPKQAISISFESKEGAAMVCEVPFSAAWKRIDDAKAASTSSSLLPLQLTARGLLAMDELGLESLASAGVRVTAKSGVHGCAERDDSEAGNKAATAGAAGGGGGGGGGGGRWEAMLQELLSLDAALLLQAGPQYPATLERGRWYALMPVQPPSSSSGEEGRQTTAAESALLYRLQTREGLCLGGSSHASVCNVLSARSDNATGLAMDVDTACSRDNAEAPLLRSLLFSADGDREDDDSKDGRGGATVLKHRVRYHPLLFTDGLLEGLYSAVAASVDGGKAPSSQQQQSNSNKKNKKGEAALLAEDKEPDFDASAACSGPLALLFENMASALPQGCRGEAWNKGGRLEGGETDEKEDEAVVMRTLEEELMGLSAATSSKVGSKGAKTVMAGTGNDAFALLKGFFPPASRPPVALLQHPAVAPAPPLAGNTAGANRITRANAAATTTGNKRGPSPVPPPAAVTPQGNGNNTNKSRSAVAAPPAGVTNAAKPVNAVSVNSTAPALPVAAALPPALNDSAAKDPGLLSWEDLFNQGLETLDGGRGAKTGAVPASSPYHHQTTGRDPRRPQQHQHQHQAPQTSRPLPSAKPHYQPQPQHQPVNRLDRVVPLSSPVITTAASPQPQSSYFPPPPPPPPGMKGGQAMSAAPPVLVPSPPTTTAPAAAASGIGKRVGPVVRPARSASSSSSSSSSSGPSSGSSSDSSSDASLSKDSLSAAAAAAGKKPVTRGAGKGKVSAAAVIDLQGDSSSDDGDDDNHGADGNCGRGTLGGTTGGKKLVRKSPPASAAAATRGRGRGGRMMTARGGKSTGPNAAAAAANGAGGGARKRRVGVIEDEDEDEEGEEDISLIEEAEMMTTTTNSSSGLLNNNSNTPGSSSYLQTIISSSPDSSTSNPLLAALADDLELAAELGLQTALAKVGGSAPTPTAELLSLLASNDENHKPLGGPQLQQQQVLKTITGSRPSVPPAAAAAAALARPSTGSSILNGATTSAALPSLMEVMALRSGSDGASGDKVQPKAKLFRPTAADIAILSGKQPTQAPPHQPHLLSSASSSLNPTAAMAIDNFEATAAATAADFEFDEL